MPASSRAAVGSKVLSKLGSVSQPKTKMVASISFSSICLFGISAVKASFNVFISFLFKKPKPAALQGLGWLIN